MVERPGVRARVRAPARRRSSICRRIGRRARGAAAGARAGQLPEPRADRIGADPPAPRRAPTASSAGSASRRLLGRVLRRAVHAQRLALRAVGSPGVASRRWSGCSIEHQPVAGGGRRIPGLVFSEVPLLRTARRRGVPQHGDRSELGQLHQQADSGPPVDRLVVWNDIMKAAGGRRSTATSRRDPRRRRAAVRPALPPAVADAARRVLPAHRRRSVAQADRADDDAAVALPPSRSRAARAGRRRSTAARWPDAQVLVRLHPRDDVDAYREFAGMPHVIIEKPFRDTVKVGRRPGDRRDAGAPAAPRRHAVPRRRRRQRRVDDRDRGVHLRHAGREHLLRRPDAERRT